MPALTVCHCDPAWPAYAVCPTCELRRLEAVLARRGLVARERALDAGDHHDRARERADNHMAERGGR